MPLGARGEAFYLIVGELQGVGIAANFFEPYRVNRNASGTSQHQKSRLTSFTRNAFTSSQSMAVSISGIGSFSASSK